MKFRDRLLKGLLAAVRPVLFYFINSPLLLVSSRYFMRWFDPKRDILVDVRGIRMYANSLDRLLALLFWKYALVEGFEADVMKRLVRRGMTVVNCGANIGYYTLHLAQWVGTDGKVVAFEPDPNSFRLLVKNAKANGLRNISFVQAAVSDEAGKAQLFFCEENRGDHRLFDSGDSRRAISVDMLALDDYFPPGSRIDLIKMDIQGSELRALRGMQRLLEENEDLIILSEFCPVLLEESGASGRSYLKEIERLGFEVLFIDESLGQVRTLDAERLLSHCRSEYYCSIIIKRPHDAARPEAVFQERELQRAAQG